MPWRRRKRSPHPGIDIDDDFDNDLNDIDAKIVTDTNTETETETDIDTDTYNDNNDADESENHAGGIDDNGYDDIAKLLELDPEKELELIKSEQSQQHVDAEPQSIEDILGLDAYPSDDEDYDSYSTGNNGKKNSIYIKHQISNA